MEQAPIASPLSRKNHPASPTQGETSSSEVLYTSKGYPAAYLKKKKIYSAIVCCLGVFVLFLSQARHSTSSVSYYAGNVLTGSGTLGGGYVFNSDGRQMLIYLGIFALVAGVATFFMLNKLNESFALTLTETRVEGMDKGTSFSCSYEQVLETLSDVRSGLSAVTIVTVGGKHRVIVAQDAHTAVKIIRDRSGC